MKIRIPFSVLLFAAACLPCTAQTMYESKDKAGNTVFSDRPTPGAKAVEMAPPNVIQTPSLPKSGPHLLARRSLIPRLPSRRSRMKAPSTPTRASSIFAQRARPLCGPRRATASG